MGFPARDTSALAACTLPRSTAVYPDEALRAIYARTSTIAMVGASPNWNRPSYFVMRYLQRKGFRVIPVNPRALDAPILGEHGLPGPRVDPDADRRRGRLPQAGGRAGHRDGRPRRSGPRCCGSSSGITSAEAGTIAGLAGLTFIEDHCMKIEYGRLSGELAWSGINTRILSSRRGSALR